jgi:signal transduction histidine kinase
MKMLIDKILVPFRQLRWRLTLSYMLVTVAALLVVEIVLFFGLSTQLMDESKVGPETIIGDLDVKYVPIASSYLSRTPPDINGLRRYLAPESAYAVDAGPYRVGDFMINIYSTNIVYIVFIGANGALLDTLPHGFIQDSNIGGLFRSGEIPGLEDPLRAALRGETDLDSLYATGSKSTMTGAIPVFDEFGKDRVVGAVGFVRRTSFWDVWTFSGFARQVGMSLLISTLFAAILGAIFGTLTAQGLVSRLRKLFVSARAWSRGDFSIHVSDPAHDEIGRLSRGLDHMASQLESLLIERQEMSVLEERNRLARDLHDSVKQQAFAASAQLAAAKAHYMKNPVEAELHLLEAEKLLFNVRHELTDLLLELRPVALEGRGLPTAVREFVHDCANQSGIDIEVDVKGERSLPLEVEQTIFRILQGALSNVIRHSQATHATVQLIYDTHTVELDVTDDGVGFDATQWHNGLGLRLLRERTALLKGNLILRSEPGEGTQVRVKCGV